MKIASTSIAATELEQPGENRSSPTFLEWRVIATALFVAVGCFAGSLTGVWLRFPEGTAIVFPSYAVLTAALLILPFRNWWICLLASLIGHFGANLGHWSIEWVLFSELANYTKALVAAAAIVYFNGSARFDSFRSMAIFISFAIFIGPASGAFLGAGASAVLHPNPVNSFWLTWRAWFLSNALTGATLLPALLAAIVNFRSWLRNASAPRLVEATTLSISLLALGYFALIFPTESFTTLPPNLYSLLPVLLWAAVRFGSGGTSMAVFALSCATIAGAIHGKGPFAAITETLLSLQLFLIILSIPMLFLAALIEERDRIEERLRERDERIGLAAETANFALWTIDFERQESWMSQKGRELFGFLPNEPLSRELLLARVHPEDRHLVDEAITRASLGAQTFEIEHRLLRPDGETRWMIARGRDLRNERGELSELIGVGIDVTAQVKATLELRVQREEMARLGRVSVMGQLTASLAHELNQPLAAISSNVAAGRRSLALGAIDRQMFEELLSDVSADTRRAAGIIQGIRQFMRKGEGATSAVDLNEMIREVLRLLNSDLAVRLTRVEMNLADHLPPIQASPVQLQQVLLNLIMNSLEAMQEAPADRRRILISTEALDGFVLARVRDYGAGLPKQNPDAIFSQFFSTKPNGMGMGLTIVRSIIEAHGGELRAEDLTDGAAFFFTLPVP